MKRHRVSVQGNFRWQAAPHIPMPENNHSEKGAVSAVGAFYPMDRDGGVVVTDRRECEYAVNEGQDDALRVQGCEKLRDRNAGVVQRGYVHKGHSFSNATGNVWVAKFKPKLVHMLSVEGGVELEHCSTWQKEERRTCEKDPGCLLCVPVFVCRIPARAERADSVIETFLGVAPGCTFIKDSHHKENLRVIPGDGSDLVGVVDGLLALGIEAVDLWAVRHSEGAVK